MKNLAVMLLLFMIILPAVIVAEVDPLDPWGHSVIMFPPPGATYCIPLTQGRNCVYVTDCTEPSPVLTPNELPISDIPTPRGVAGWTFGVLMDRDGWSVEVSSEHATEDRAGMLDGDPMTIWRSGSAGHSETGVFPHTVIFDMKRESWVDGMIYTPRPYDVSVSYSENGTIADYEIWISNNYAPAHLDEPANGTWGRVASGTFTYETHNQTQRVDFLIPNKARWIKLVAISDIKGTNIAAAGEIYITESLRDIEITGGAVQ